MLDSVTFGLMFLGVTALFGNIALGLGLLLIGVPVVWSIRNNYLRPRAYRELGVDPSTFQITVVGRSSDGTDLLGFGAWHSSRGWEPVCVVRSDSRFNFETPTGYLYGKNVGGYGVDDLLTLYLTGKLSLNPRLVGSLTDGPVADIADADGNPLFAGAGSVDEFI